MRIYTIHAELDKKILFQVDFKASGKNKAEEKRRAFDLAIDHAYFILRSAPYGMCDKLANLTVEHIEFDVVDVSNVEK